MLIYIYLFLFISQPDRGSLGKSDGTGLTVKDKLNQAMDEEENFRDFFSLTSPFCSRDGLGNCMRQPSKFCTIF